MTAEEEAVQVDSYLDGLLAGRYAGPRPQGIGDDIDPDLGDTVRLVQRALTRFHPSFSFEEWLAARLRAAGSGAPPGDLLEFPSVVRLPQAPDSRARGLLVGGAAIASGVSLAGAAFLVRRRGRGGSRRPQELGI